jgi:TolA-binding protein
MNSRRGVTIAPITLLAACTAMAQTVYKSVDAQGRVTYSSSPPPAAADEMVEKVRIAPGPTEQQQQEAARRVEKLEEATRSAEQQRQEQTARRTQARSEAQRELRKAQIALEEARIKGDGDWQTLATGGRVLKQSYLDRVDNAERRVRQAQDAARGAGSSRR